MKVTYVLSQLDLMLVATLLLQVPEVVWPKHDDHVCSLGIVMQVATSARWVIVRLSRTTQVLTGSTAGTLKNLRFVYERQAAALVQLPISKIMSEKIFSHNGHAQLVDSRVDRVAQMQQVPSPNISIFKSEAYRDPSNVDYFARYIGNGTRLLRSMQELYELSPAQAEASFYRAWRQAGEILDGYVATTFPSIARSLSQVNIEEGVSPHDLAHLLALQTDPVAHHQAKVRTVVAKCILDGEQAYTRHQIPQKMAIANRALSAHIYTQRLPEACVYSLHDNATNDVVATQVSLNCDESPGFEPNRDTHIKELHFPHRKLIAGKCEVAIATSARIKNLATAIFKSLAKAKHKVELGGSINPNLAINDMAGFGFTSLSDEVSIEEMCDATMRRLRDVIPGCETRLRMKTAGRPGQAIEDIQRFDLYLPGFPPDSHPLEFIFTTLEGRIKSDYQTHTSEGLARGFADGPAHALYELRRYRSLADVIIPPSLATRLPLEVAYMHALDLKVRDLKTDARYSPQSISGTIADFGAKS